MQRRQFIVLSALALTGLSLGASGFTLGSLSSESFLLGQLHRLAGDFGMAGEQQGRMLGDFIATYGAEKLLVLIGLFEMREHLGVSAHYANEKIEHFERNLVTHFLTSTDYLRQYQLQASERPEISYWGQASPCRNPFACFDD